MDILYEAPVIFTKDSEWVGNYAEKIKIVPGAIILLPEDAVLYSPPYTVSVDVSESAAASPPQKEETNAE